VNIKTLSPLSEAQVNASAASSGPKPGRAARIAGNILIYFVGPVVISAYLGAAACAHLQTDQYGGIGPAVFLIGCCWIGVALRHPQVLWSFPASGPVERSPESSLVGASSGSKSSDLTHSSQI
jgi:uncharacterized membrane protein YfcA